MGVRVVQVEILSEEAIRPMGQTVQLRVDAAPDLSGPTWSCWYPLARVPGSRPLLLGLVETRPVRGPVTLMERHEGRVEVLIALDRPIVQMVAPYTRRSARPLADSVRAFLVRPGEALILSPGTWHAPAAAVSADVTRYLFGLPEQDHSDLDSGWTVISDGGVALDLGELS